MWEMKSSMRFLIYAMLSCFCMIFALASSSTLSVPETRSSFIREYVDSGTDLTIIYRTSRLYSTVIEMHYTASFIIESDRIEDSTLVKSVRNNQSEQSLVVNLSESFLAMREPIPARVQMLQRNFQDITEMSLKYVLISFFENNPSKLQEYVDAFEQAGVVVFSNRVLVNSASPDVFGPMNFIDFDSFNSTERKNLAKKLKKLRKESRVKPMGLDEFVGRYSRVSRRAIESSRSERTVTASTSTIHQGTSSATMNQGMYFSGSSGTSHVELSAGNSISSRPMERSIRTNPSDRYSRIEPIRAVLAPSNPVLTRCRIEGSFLVLFRGIEHYQTIIRHFNRAVFLVTFHEMISFGESLNTIIREGGDLIVLLAAEDLVDYDSAAQLEVQISDILREYETTLSYVMFPSEPVIPVDIRSIFTSKHNVTEVQRTIEFTSAEMNLERIGEAFDFQGFVLVDTTITDAIPLLMALETKLERQECEPISFNDCIIGRRSSETAFTEIEKNERFRAALEMSRQNVDYMARNVSVRRATIFEESFDSLRHVPPADLKRSFFRITFIGEAGIDAGGLLREWYSLLIREVFNPNYALFHSLETNQNVFVPNSRSVIQPGYEDYFRFVGRFIGKAIVDNVPIECRLSRAMYKLMLGRSLTLFDLQEVDAESHQSLSWMATNQIEGVMDGLTFSLVTDDNFGQRREINLIPGGAGIEVTDINKHEYIASKIQYLLHGSVQTQLDSFLEGFHQMIPRNMISSFTVSELQRLISGVAEIDVDDWERNSQYNDGNFGYSAQSQQILWFWQAVRSFTPSERRKLLHYVTGSPSVPLEGFAMLRNHGLISPFRVVTSYDDLTSLPVAHTCFNRLDLPRYADYETLRQKVLLAANEGTGSFLIG